MVEELIQNWGKLRILFRWGRMDRMVQYIRTYEGVT
jgi:hypothetical protein